MGNFRYRMLQFMIGRNGFDAFCRGLLFLAMILIIADIFIPGRIVRPFPGISQDEAQKTPGIFPAWNFRFNLICAGTARIISILNVPPVDRCSGLLREEDA